MPKYFYQAYTMARENKQGVIEAKDKNHALEKLSSLSLFPLIIESEEADADNATVKQSKVKHKEAIVFTRQLSNLLGSGFNILSALQLTIKQKWSYAFLSIVKKLIKDLKEGMTFSDALAQHPEVFSGLYVALIRAGENGGFLEGAAQRLSELMEKEEDLKEKVKSAMVYPLFIAIVGIATVFILLGFVIPKLILVFEDFGQELPLPTRILVNISSFFRTYWWVIIVFILIFFAARRMFKTPNNRIFLDELKLKVPILGEIILKREMEQFSRILAALLDNGVTILVSLGIVCDIIDNRMLKKEVENIKLAVKDGVSLAEAAAKARHFPTALVNIISVGEEGGNLEAVLKKISHTYDRELDRSLKALSSLLEPFMILVMGLVVSFIVAAMLLPIFQLNFITQ